MALGTKPGLAQREKVHQRRSLCGELEQIQFLLGHTSVQTTERYLCCEQNLGSPVNDRFKRTEVQLREANFESAAVNWGPREWNQRLATAYNAATEASNMSSPSSPNAYPHRNKPTWSRSEKSIAPPPSTLLWAGSFTE